jgi:RNA polymerase sigma-54 factor
MAVLAAKMRPSLQLKLSQHLALTPQLQQSIRLLQLSTLELEQELEKYLLENPLLEREEEEYAPPPPPLPGSSEEEAAAASRKLMWMPSRHRPTTTAGSAMSPAIRALQLLDDDDNEYQDAGGDHCAKTSNSG